MKNQLSVEEDDERFVDSIKKTLNSSLSKLIPKMADKPKEAIELHRKFQDIEVDIKIHLARNENDMALDLAKTLKHDSSYLIDGTNTKYCDYWEVKRQNYLDVILEKITAGIRTQN